jgi:predicted acyltransferase (DUF342 family)
MNKKFSLTRNEKKQAGITLFQIKAEVSFGNVEKGELGGWVEKEENLSHDGDAWVYGNALVYGNAWVHGDAQVSGDAWVYGNARVHGDARVHGNALVSGNALVRGNALVSGNAWVHGDAQVSGDARVHGDARVSGNAQISGNARVYGNARVHGDAWVYGNARVHGDARVYGKLKIIAGSFFGIRRKGEEIKYIQIDDDVELIYKGEARFGEEEKETIKIGEVEYDKADVEERLKGIKPVN